MSGRIGVVLLAAGGGTRFRETAGALGVPVVHKLVAPLRGSTVFEHALANAVEADVGPIAVVTGAVLLAVLDRQAAITILHNDSWSSGQATSLALGLAWADREGLDAVLCGLGDQPFIPADAWRAVADASPDKSKPVSDGIIPGRVGFRNAPTAAYSSFSPPLRKCWTCPRRTPRPSKCTASTNLSRPTTNWPTARRTSAGNA